MPGSTTRELVAASAAVGIPPLPPTQLIATASAELRIALDDGLPRTHPKCEALLFLINAARLHLVPKKQRSVPRADGLSKSSEEIAADIDTAATATATSIGLRDAEILRRNASHIIKTASRRTSARAESEKAYTIPIKKSRAGALKMRLLPRAAISSVDSIFEIIRTDAALGNAAKARKRELADGPAERRKRYKTRRARRATMDFETATRDPSGLTAEDVQNFTPSGRFPPRTTPVGPTRSSPTAHTADNYSAFTHMPYMGSIAGSTLNVRQQLFAQHQQNHSYATQDRVVPSLPIQITAGPSAPQLVPAPAPAPQNLPTESEDPERFRANSIRTVLAERERNVLRRLSQRQAELLSLPLGVSEDVRRKAIIESKQMKLLETQRRVRSKLCIEMKKSWSPSYNEFGVVPNDHLSKLCRRHQLVYTFTDGFPRASPYDAEPAPPPPRHPSIIARESRRMAAYDRRRMLEHERHKKAAFAHRLAIHVQGFENYYSVAHHTRSRICRAVQRFFVEKAKAEEKRKKMEQYERLRLLKSNDEQAYFNLLKSTKNERLLQLIRQTDNYLMQIGAQVEKGREFNEPETITEPSMFSKELKESKEVPQSIDSMKGRRNMYYTVTHSIEEEVEQPNIMVFGKLKSYQLEGLKWLVSLYNNGLNGILADEMGLGKTIQTIALLTYLIERKKNPGPYLVIVPLSTVGNWVRELDLWAPSVNKIVYRGNRDARRQCEYQMSGGNFNVVITTYEFVVRDVALLSRFRWQYIIIDEGHRMKNSKCKLAMTLGSKYRSKNRLLLTGTPLQNNLTELWALLNFLLPSIFSSADTFEQWFKKPFETTTLGDTAELEEEETLLIINRLHQVLRPFLLRRLKTDVEHQLPDKVETVIRCDMSKWQRVLMRQCEAKVGLAMGANGTVRSFNNLLMQCKKICNHPYLFYDEEALMDLSSEMLIKASGKFHLLQHLIPKLKAGGHRTLIFSQMTSALDYLEDFLTEIDTQYLRLDGGTKSELRQEMLNDFNAVDSPYFCFLLSTRAGGLGLNLQTADTVIIFDSDWNPMMDLQAQDRAHRIGQKNQVRVFRMITSNSIEVKILDRANRKLEIDAQVIQAGQFNNKSTERDQRQMLQELLSKKTSDDDEFGDVPTIEELNRIVARNDEEFEMFTRIDKEREENNPYCSLISEDTELPSWVLKPDKTYKTPEEREREIIDTHGRGRRKRRNIKYVDQMSEKDFQAMVLIEES